MGKPLSIDNCSWLVAAVAGVASRRAAAKRFGIYPPSAERWVQAVSTAGTVEAKLRGGDTRYHRIEVFNGVILAAVAARKDLSLVDLAELLRIEHGASIDASTVWRCLDHHGTNLKKQRTRPNRNGPTSPPAAGRSFRPNLTSTRSAWFSSMKPAPQLRWLGCEAVP